MGAGAKAGFGDQASLFSLAVNAWTVNLGTATGAGTTGAPINITAGGGYTSGTGGALNLSAGPAGGSGPGGSVTITATDGNANEGGNITLQAGENSEGSATNGYVHIYAGNGYVADAAPSETYVHISTGDGTIPTPNARTALVLSNDAFENCYLDIIAGNSDYAGIIFGRSNTRYLGGIDYHTNSQSMRFHAPYLPWVFET